jgi:N-acetylmuramoyl-L-alanine amidase
MSLRKPNQIILILSLICWVWIHFFPAQGAPASNAKTAMQAADNCRRGLYLSTEKMKLHERWLNCINLYQAIVTHFPKSSEAGSALYWEGKMYRDLYGQFHLSDDLEMALKCFEQLSTDYPEHRLADDAQFQIGEIYYQEKKDYGRAYVEFLKVDVRFPNGDMRPKAQEMMEQLSNLISEKVESNWSKQNDKKPASTAPQTLTRVTGIRHISTPTYTRVVIELEKPVKYDFNVLKAEPSHKRPRRLYLDLKESYVTTDMDSNIPIRDGLLQAARAGQYAKGIVRVVLDIQNIGGYKIFPLYDPFRIVVDVSSVEKPEPVKTAKNSKPLKNGKKPKPENGTSAPVQHGTKKAEEPDNTATIVSQLNLNVKKIVLDPGHGGRDPGCLFEDNLKEKDIVLNLARILSKKIQEKIPGCEVVLTRDKDAFVPLDERTGIANAQKADLFISLHVNAHKQNNVAGLETYFLNIATDESAMMAAARENATSEKNISDLQSILKDLMLNTNIHESSKLAYDIQKGMLDNLTPNFNPVKDLGVKQAPFYVLIGANMPAILLETGFITNPIERKRLQSPEYLEELAAGMVNGIRQYIGSISQAAAAGY